MNRATARILCCTKKITARIQAEILFYMAKKLMLWKIIRKLKSPEQNGRDAVRVKGVPNSPGLSPPLQKVERKMDFRLVERWIRVEPGV